MILLLLTNAAGALTPGDPLAPTDEPVRLAVGLSQLSMDEVDAGCDGPECAARWSQRTRWVAARYSVTPTVGLFGGIGRRVSDVEGADYSGRETFGGLGVTGVQALPEVRWALGATARSEWSMGSDVDGGSADGLSLVAELDAVAIWGEPAQGISVWAGGSRVMFSRHQLRPLGSQGEALTVRNLFVPLVDSSDPLVINLSPASQMSGIAGLAMTSPELGPSWGNPARLAVGVSASLGAIRGVDAWASVLF